MFIVVKSKNYCKLNKASHKKAKPLISATTPTDSTRVLCAY